MNDFHIKKYVDALRAWLDLLKKEAMRVKRIKRWKQAAKAIAENSKPVNKEFQKLSRFKNYDHS